MKLTSALCLLVFMLVVLVPTARADNLSDARKLMDRGMYVSASRILAPITKDDSENHEAWALLAECQLSFGDSTSAYESAFNALDLSGDKNPDYWVLLGKASFAKGEAAYMNRAPGAEIKLHYADAEAKFMQALKRRPDDPELLWRLGYSKEWQEYPKKAREYYDRQIAKHPEVSEGYLRLGAQIAGDAIATDNGQSDAAKKVRAEALKVFETGIAKGGPNAEIFYNIGIAHEWNGEWAKAKDSYLAAIDADPESDKTWRRLHEKYLGDGTKDYQVTVAQLVEFARKSLKKVRNCVAASTWAGFFLVQERKHAEALAILLPTLKEHQEATGIYGQASKAAWELRTSNVEGYLAAYAKIHEYYPFEGSAANNIALYYRDRRSPGPDYVKSLEWYLKSVEREPNNQDLVNDTALIYLFHTKGATRKKCLPMYEKVLSLVHDDGQKPIRGYWDALENLCLYYWEVERNPELVVKFAKMRYETTMGVEPYNMSPKALHFKKLAEQELK